jgi:hypothetical protein
MISCFHLDVTRRMAVQRFHGDEHALTFDDLPPGRLNVSLQDAGRDVATQAFNSPR